MSDRLYHALRRAERWGCTLRLHHGRVQVHRSAGLSRTSRLRTTLRTFQSLLAEHLDTRCPRCRDARAHGALLWTCATCQVNPPWSRRVGEDVRWLLESGEQCLPKEPFDLSPGRRVVAPQRFLAFLRLDIGRGPNGPRCRFGALQAELRRLRELFDREEEHA